MTLLSYMESIIPSTSIASKRDTIDGEWAVNSASQATFKGYKRLRKQIQPHTKKVLASLRNQTYSSQIMQLILLRMILLVI